MIEVGSTGPSQRWDSISLALLAGLMVASSGFGLTAVVQTPGLDPPPESVALFVVVTSASVLSYLLVRWEVAVGYPAAVLTGAFVFVTLGLVGTGTLGPIGPRTNPVGPVFYAALGTGVVGATLLAWRGGRTE